MDKIAVIGLGYVGLPIAVALSRRFERVIGFDINQARIDALKAGHDETMEVESAALKASNVAFSADTATLQEATAYIVTVPTPIDSSNRPDLGAIKAASRMVATALKPGDLVIYESTVYPGVTEDICGAILAEVSGLSRNDFSLGYSPERINPGDKVHRLETIVKVVSADSDQALERVCDIYNAVVDAGLHRASSIRVAEAAKVIENTQRDLNIALMNELALIFDRLDIPTHDVLEAAGTKWNFLKFSPGLVGGHCIGVDPYYLTAKAEEVGYSPEVILAGRRINDGMGAFIAHKALRLLLSHQGSVRHISRIGIFGLTFKEDVPDLRNSRVPDIFQELQAAGLSPMVCDPLADAEEAMHEYGIKLTPRAEMVNLDAAIVAVAHTPYRDETSIIEQIADNGVIIDVKSILDAKSIPGSMKLWQL